MDFKTAIEHYQNGTATEEERLWVEEELDKFLLLEALVREDAPAGMPTEQEGSADFQSIRRRLRKRSVLQIVTSVLLTLALLLGYGYNLGIYGADGDFGSATDKAVKEFQREHDLGADGEVGNLTWAKLLGV